MAENVPGVQAMTPHAKDTALWIDTIRSVCDPKIYLDVGAGDGFDCALVKSAFPLCRCAAIEPVEVWEAGDEIEKHRDVIGQDNKFSVFYVKTIPGIHGLYDRKAVSMKNAIAVPVRTLARFCEREKIETIDAMKIDVEGAAWDVIAGAQELFSKVKAVHIETEWLPLFDGQRLEQDVFCLLDECGLTKVYEDRVLDLGQGDSIWVRQ